jgi:hypothetical protein
VDQPGPGIARSVSTHVPESVACRTCGGAVTVTCLGCDLAVVISNDSDLETPIRAVMQDLRVPVGLLNPHPVYRRSRDLLNLGPVFFKQIRPNAVKNSQFPDQLSDANGTFRRPATW